MSLVTLVSGGLDSTVMAILTESEGIQQYPLFVNYGQRNLEKELHACLSNFQKHALPTPRVVDLSGYGQLISSGLTDIQKRVKEDAFLPGRNHLFLLVAQAYAFQMQATAISLGLLYQETPIFPDQGREFLETAEKSIGLSLGRYVRVLTPLATLTKADVVKLAKEIGVVGTYSCHAGSDPPCGLCIACLEYVGLEE